MKTREQAEARALELYPKTDIATVNQLHEVSRDAYLQGWEDSQVAMDAKQADVKVEGISDGTEGVIEGVTEGVSGKQTCGFCVETKQHQKELLCEMMRKDEEDGLYELTKDDIEELLDESEKEINSLQKYKQRCETGCKKFYGGEILHHKDCFFYPESITKQHDQLREAAEKVVYEWHNSVGEECIDAAMVKLVKVLNSKKH